MEGNASQPVGNAIARLAGPVPAANFLVHLDCLAQVVWTNATVQMAQIAIEAPAIACVCPDGWERDVINAVQTGNSAPTVRSSANAKMVRNAITSAGIASVPPVGEAENAQNLVPRDFSAPIVPNRVAVPATMVVITSLVHVCAQRDGQEPAVPSVVHSARSGPPAQIDVNAERRRRSAMR